MPLVITLDSNQYAAAESLGKKRQQLKIDRGLGQKEANDGGGSWMYKNGYSIVAEYALARHYGTAVLVDWVDNKAFSRTPWRIPCDVGLDLHVRATDEHYKKYLIVHEDKGRTRIETPYERRENRVSDPLNGVFIFAWVDSPRYRVTFYGWEMAQNVRNLGRWNTEDNGFKDEDRHAYTLERGRLQPMETIPKKAIWHDACTSATGPGTNV